MVVLDRLREYRTKTVDERKRKRAVSLDIGDFIMAENEAKGFCLTPGKEYNVLNICPIYENKGLRNFQLRNVLIKLADDNGTIKEVSYSVFRY